jgi:CRP-like cAMP-binding protein
MKEALRNHIKKIVSPTDAEFEFISSHFTEQSFNRRDFIFKAGDQVAHVYFVVSGLLMLTYDDDSGKQHVVAFAMEDWWESDYHAFYNEGKATMSLQCLESTTVFRLTLEGYRTLCFDMHKMEHFFLEKANRGHITATDTFFLNIRCHGAIQ